MSDFSIFIAFSAGIISVFSPCILPIFPSLLAYLTGMSLSEIEEDNALFQRRALWHTFFFLIGFSVIFVAIGLATSLIGQLFTGYQNVFRILGALLMIVFGMVIAGILQPKFLMQTKKIEFKNKPTGYFGTFLVGLAFSAGWSPCIGPVVGYIASLSVANPELGALYMVTYLIGFAIPFFILVFFVGKIKLIRKYSQKIMVVGGYLMVVLGFILLLDWMPSIISFFSGIFS